ncbi:MAG: SGNH/GDSL hydrolase family protein [Nitrospinota bacterium]|nr:SGNH/GDSL hydrolase family protein [Nitrospinota bacterium]
MLETNSIGMRSSREYPEKTSSGRKRILLLGDSYTAGDGVDNSERFSDIMESRFPWLDVMNFGLNGSGTDQQTLIFEQMASRLEADAYIFCLCPENIARCQYTCFPSMSWSEHQLVYRPKPYFELSENDLELRNQPVPHEKRSVEALGDWKCDFPYSNEFPEDPYAIYRFPDSSHWRLQKKILERFIGQTGEKPVYLVPMPMDRHYFEKSTMEFILERYRELEAPEKNIRVVDLMPAMLKDSAQERKAYRFPDDPHYTAKAHQVVANGLANEIGKYNSDFFLQGSQ